MWTYHNLQEKNEYFQIEVYTFTGNEKLGAKKKYNNKLNISK